MKVRGLLLIILSMLTVLFADAKDYSLVPSDDNWSDIFGGPAGPAGDVYAIVSDNNGNIYVGGDFINASGVAVNYIAKWDGTSWTALGSGMDKPVYALAIDAAGNLYAGGDFTTAGGTTVNHIAKWDGTSWTALGSGVDNTVFTIAIDNNNYVYAGGRFTNAGGNSAKYVAKWNGSSWSPLSTGMNSYVFVLKFDSSNNLYAGGSFTSAGYTTANRFAKWDGVAWYAFGDGMNNTVRAIEFDGSGKIYAGGEFTTADGNTVNYITYWNGSSWSAMGSGTNGEVRAMIYDGTNIIIGGNFTYANGNVAGHIAKWNGTSLVSFGSNVNDNIYAIDLSSNGHLFIGGAFNVAGNATVSKVAEYDGSSWSKTGTTDNGLNDIGQVVVTDNAGNVYVAGNFSSAGGVAASKIAKWDGSSWTVLGSGFDGNVYALAIDNSGNIYAGGDFTTAGGNTVNYIAKWDGASWSALGSGVNDIVYAIKPDGAGNIYVGGRFTTAGGTTVNYIAKWNGSSWSALGSGMNSDVFAITIDSQGNIYAGGGFSIAGGNIINYVAKWDGASWSGLGSGMNNVVRTLACDTDDNLYAGGSFSTAGGKTVNYIAKWDGSSWSALGSGANSEVYSVIVDTSNYVYVGGKFTVVDGNNFNYVAKWNGSQWMEIGGGMDNTVHGLAIDTLGNLYATGEFTTAGAKNSAYFAIYTFKPDIELYGNSQQIFNNDFTPSFADSTDFDTIVACNSSVTKRFVIRNTGDWGMNIISIELSGDNPEDFHLSNIPKKVAIADSEAFNITLGPSKAGYKSAIVTITTDAEHNSSFSYKIQGFSQDTLKPVFSAQNFTVHLDVNGQASISNSDIVTSATDNCDIVDTVLSRYDFDCSDIDSVPVKISVTVIDENGNFDTDTVEITVEDNIVPVLSTVASKTVALDASGTATLVASDIVTGATDNCETDTLFTKGVFDCSYADSTFEVGVILRDTYGNADTQFVQITVVDTIRPQITVSDTVVELDSSGQVILSECNFANFVVENCSVGQITFSQDTFDCSGIGVHAVDMTVSDVNGNLTTKTINVTIADSIRPFFEAHDITLALDQSGIAVVPGTTIDTVYDNCSIRDTVFLPGTLDCSSLGENQVIVRLTDVNDNVSYDTITVTIIDTLPPVPLNNILNDVTAQCSVTLTPPQANDNCSGQVYATTNDPLYYDEQGSYTVTWTYTDDNGNSISQKQTVIIWDNTPPVPGIDSLPVISGLCELTVDEIPTAQDNCRGTITAITADDLYYSSPGQYLITWIYDDNNHNVTEQTQVAEVINEPPVVLTRDITVMLDVNGHAEITAAQIDDGSYDDCQIDTMTLDKYVFTLDDVGENTVTLTVTDNAQNQASEQAIVTIIKYPDLKIPNYISPNGDNVNDVWEITGIDHLIGYQLYIYSQSNELVYQSDAYDNSWDGTYQGKVLPTGTYYYVFTNGTNKISGFITLVK